MHYRLQIWDTQTLDNLEDRSKPLIDEDGTVLNGPFQTCECSGPLFFGEDRIECFGKPQRRIVGDMIVLCMWNDVVKIDEIRQVQVSVSASEDNLRPNANAALGSSYVLIEEGIPDIMTHTYIRPDRLAAVVATTLDASWFPEKNVNDRSNSSRSNTGFLHSASAVVKADGVFGFASPHDVNDRNHPHDRSLLDVGERLPVSVILIGFVLLAALALNCLCCCLCDRYRTAEDEGPISNLERDFEKHVEVMMSSTPEVTINSNPHVLPDLPRQRGNDNDIPGHHHDSFRLRTETESTAETIDGTHCGEEVSTNA
jgi:hypothetical protein